MPNPETDRSMEEEAAAVINALDKIARRTQGAAKSRADISEALRLVGRARWLRKGFAAQSDTARALRRLESEVARSLKRGAEPND
jgi:hypothetical protein